MQSHNSPLRIIYRQYFVAILLYDLNNPVKMFNAKKRIMDEKVKNVILNLIYNKIDVEIFSHAQI